MKNRGFTLLELLGVIVILALLTTLVFPSVLNAIKKSSNQTDKLSMDLISNAADLYIENNLNEFIKFNGNKYIIEIENLIEEGNLPNNIKMSDIDNINDVCIQTIYQDGFKYELKEKGTCEKLVQFDSICKFSSDSIESGMEVGAKYKCKVDPDRDDYLFYILSYNDEDGNITFDYEKAKSINLIMDRNINSDGTPTTKAITKTDSENGVYNLEAWVIKEDYIKLDIGEIEDEWNEVCEDCGNWNKGPITAFNFLKKATKTWKNAEYLKINSFDLYDADGNAVGKYELEESYSMYAYARMPHYIEVSDVTNETLWLIDYLDGEYDEDIPVIGRNSISQIYGYWTLSFCATYPNKVWFIHNQGFIDYDDDINNNSAYGVRPVITLPIINL